MTSPGIVVVGANLAGGRAVETLRAEGYDGTITMIGDEPIQPYERPPLSKEFLRGEQPIDKAFLRTEQWYRDNTIELRLGVRAEHLDIKGHSVSLSDGSKVAWNKLLLATGARPRRLDVSGSDMPGVLLLRTVVDAIAINDQLKPGARVVVIGAGFIGSEVAASARMKGCEVTIVEIFDVPLQRALGPEVGAAFTSLHLDNGVTLRLGTQVKAFRGDTWVRTVELSDGTTLEADVVIVGVGVVPNVEVAEDAGLVCNDGIVVNELCKTSAPDVFAAGDVANHPNPILGHRIRIEHWQNAQNQGAHAAKTMMGSTEPYSEVPWFWSDQYDLNLQMAGHPVKWDRIVVRGSLQDRKGCAFYMDKGRMIAAVGLNSGKEVRGAKALIAAGITPSDAALADTGTDLRALAKATP
jgi:3-phenylpropionate/trans-cinnamate dioxygenase ferredoxin reductase component